MLRYGTQRALRNHSSIRHLSQLPRTSKYLSTSTRNLPSTQDRLRPFQKFPLQRATLQHGQQSRRSYSTDSKRENKDLPWILIDEAEVQKEWKLPESEYEVPRVIRPILFFVGVGSFSFIFFAYITVKDTEDAMKYEIAKKDKLALAFFFILFGFEKFPLWFFLDADDPRYRAKAGMIVRSLLYFHRPEEGWEENQSPTIYSRASDSFTYFSLIAREGLISLPVQILSFTLFIGILACRGGRSKNSAINFIRKHLTFYPAANRPHTLTTSLLSHTRWDSIFIYWFVLLALGCPEPGNGKFYTDMFTKSQHTVESTSLFQFFAFCIATGTFGNLCSQLSARLLFVRARSLFGIQHAKSVAGALPHLGAAPIAYGMLGMAIPGFLFSTNDTSLPLPQASLNPIVLGLGVVSAELLPFLLYAKRAPPLPGISGRVGGALFGFMYYYWGESLWHRCKEVFRESNGPVEAIYVLSMTFPRKGNTLEGA
ncbi:uncharacterized protein FA14DRAFT_158522 [Meira miltonrushii]|uniref:Peptidase S54 rhomboid domain-containing protein n=1 Tax=Meira miltonrushii TaxID=1280837 RepID=A0A316V2C6_9BASI|nr:uncharacterized protein FA14DRAFT_158522 [Meira miltonrushii]PWN31709.1 hypothetical protein FA14DRAFT_158522 [Meira miltonrushii]